MKIQLAKSIEPLRRPKRFKVLYGGRGGVKSWGCAQTLLILGAEKKLRILCARQVQDSIRESVHHLLAQLITSMGLDSFYRVLDREITGANGTEIVFKGLGDIQHIKSFESADIVWVEEAEGVDRVSWNTLIPTIRKLGSEIWVTFNPRLETDDTWRRFVHPHREHNLDAGYENDEVYVRKVSWRDNPWFPEVLRSEMERARLENPAEYQHIWEGYPVPALENTLIRADVVQSCIARHLREEDYKFSPRIMGVDVARYGDDSSRIARRQGLYLRPSMKFRDIDNMTLAGNVVREWNEWEADACFVDAGRGEGVIDRMIQLGYNPIAVDFGGKPNSGQYRNKRTEMWDLMRAWLEAGAAIPESTELIEDLQAPTYSYKNERGLMVLEKKEDIKERLGRSPDDGDATALTFAHPVSPHRGPGVGIHRKSDFVETNYDVYADF